MGRDAFKRFCALDIDFASIGLMEPGVPQSPYFCTPVGAEYVGRLGVDGIHFILLPGDERVFCVEPSMGEEGTYVLPVGGAFREFLSFVLYCKGANLLSQIFWMDEARFRQALAEDAAARAAAPQLRAAQEQALAALAAAFQVEPADPFARVKTLQADFDPACLSFSDEYYDVLGLGTGRAELVDSVSFTIEQKEEPSMSNCLFCKIIAGEIPSNKVYEDDLCYAFYDIDPQAPTHFLVIPKAHIASCGAITAECSAVVGHIFEVISKVAKELGITDFRVVSNCGEQAGQSVPHLHFHVLAGRDMTWPPG